MKSASGRTRRSRRPKPRENSPDRFPARSQVPVLIAYSDVSSARQAMAKLTHLLQLSGSVLQPMLWRFDQLTERRWREMAIRDACRAWTVTLAVADELAFDQVPENWLRAVLGHLQGSRLNVLALIGADDMWTLSFEQRPQKFLNDVRAGQRSSLSRAVRASTVPAAMGAAG